MKGLGWALLATLLVGREALAAEGGFEERHCKVFVLQKMPQAEGIVVKAINVTSRAKHPKVGWQFAGHVEASMVGEPATFSFKCYVLINEQGELSTVGSVRLTE